MMECDVGGGNVIWIVVMVGKKEERTVERGVRDEEGREKEEYGRTFFAYRAHTSRCGLERATFAAVPAGPHWRSSPAHARGLSIIVRCGTSTKILCVVGNKERESERCGIEAMGGRRRGPARERAGVCVREN